MANESKKVVTLDVLKAAVDKIKEDYATKTGVDEKLQESGVTPEYATRDEVLALFDDKEDSGSETA